MSWTDIHRNRIMWILLSVILSISTTMFAQSDVQEYTLLVNGQSGLILVYRINGQAFVDVEALARIANGSARIEGHQLVLSLPVKLTSVGPATAEPNSGM